MKEDFYPALQAGDFYHIYNRGNNRENIFYKEDNYNYFLKKYDAYLSDFVDTYAYCLLPNHFHLLVRVKEIEEVVSAARLSKFSKLGKSIEESDAIISEAFRRFFMSYSKAINKQEGRVGSLFQKNFKRKCISNDGYFTRLVHYIHANPQLHGIFRDYMEYPHSSYGRLLLERPSKLKRKEILDWFGGREAYVKFHTVNKDHADVKWGFGIEDD